MAQRPPTSVEKTMRHFSAPLLGVLLLAFAGASHALRVRTDDALVPVTDGGATGYTAQIDGRFTGAQSKWLYQCPVGGPSAIRFLDQPVILVALRQESDVVGAFLRNYAIRR